MDKLWPVGVPANMQHLKYAQLPKVQQKIEQPNRHKYYGQRYIPKLRRC
jgi:hypothetical protein